MFTLVKNGQVEKYPYTFEDLRNDNLQTSFPAEPSETLLASWNVFPVIDVTRPQINGFQKLIEGHPVFDGEQWKQSWAVEEFSEEERDAKTQAIAFDAREERNRRLTETDWTQIADSPVDKQAWATYRQALRDVTAQSGFPLTIDWPTIP